MRRSSHPQRAFATRQQVLQRLRAELARLDGSARKADGAAVLPLGLPAIDRLLPGGGLMRGALHELCGDGRHAAAGFAAGLLGRFAALGPVVWIATGSDLFAPGLAELGLVPERLIVVRARRQEVRLWALEEVLRSAGPAAGLAEIDKLTLTQSRRLQLAAESRGGTALLLRPLQALVQPSAACTRWRITSVPGASGNGAARGRLGAPCWEVELVRVRGGRAARWRIVCGKGGWHEEADPLAVAAEPRDRPAAAPRVA